ncbi:sterol desaturase family protein [Sphingomonas koreensis]|nr:sterol desaturase/sphingolipid hydroxylase (fatty acid hydroxylase superfamily) [Sphingomonas koreensis]RSU59627.1 sterol desaturase family protein [Sphingomonas koreensis]RSU68784.1 sterol desaturase family protein [Sphingomonas koreensis]
MRTLAATLYAPLFFLGFVGMTCWLLAAGHSPFWLLPLLLVAIAVSGTLERLIPWDPVWNKDHGDTARDITHALVNEASNIVSILAIPLLGALLPTSGLWPSHWSFVAQLALAIGLADLGITLAHYASHKSEWLWRLHAPHHSVERMYGFNGLMKHPLHQAIEMLAGLSPLLLMGLPQNIAWALAVAVSIQLMLQHSNVDMRIGLLRYVWAIAPAHRFHHIRSAREGDVNFGLFTSLWDVLLGTARFSGPPIRAGDIGIDGRPDYPRGYAAQLAEPFTGR